MLFLPALILAALRAHGPTNDLPSIASTAGDEVLAYTHMLGTAQCAGASLGTTRGCTKNITSKPADADDDSDNPDWMQVDSAPGHADVYDDYDENFRDGS